MSGRLIIQASNIHQGGGRTLLNALLCVSTPHEIIVLLDSRMPLLGDLPDGWHVRMVRPTLAGRFGAERWLAANVRHGDVVLCMGNLPPLFRLKGLTRIFIQNRYLVENVRLEFFPLKVRIRIMMERLWLYLKSGNADEFIVQTPTMKRLLEKKIGKGAPVVILPFAHGQGDYARRNGQPSCLSGKASDFVYVATGEPHKNHRRLIEAWKLLADEGYFPSLVLTLSEERFPLLCRDMSDLIGRYKLDVRNLGEVPLGAVSELYEQASAAIFPSILESFGLPLIEARQAGLPVLASERDYVRDLIDPEETFDPESPVSIARAVKRFMGIEEPPLPLLDAKVFLGRIMKEAG